MSKTVSLNRPAVSYRFQRVYPGLQTGHALTVELVFSGGVNVAQRIVVEDHKAAGSPVE